MAHVAKRQRFLDTAQKPRCPLRAAHRRELPRWLRPVRRRGILGSAIVLIDAAEGVHFPVGAGRRGQGARRAAVAGCRDLRVGRVRSQGERGDPRARAGRHRAARARRSTAAATFAPACSSAGACGSGPARGSADSACMAAAGGSAAARRRATRAPCAARAAFGSRAARADARRSSERGGRAARG